MGRFVGESIENWGNYVYAKVNSVELIKKEIKKLGATSPKILLSSVTDPYQNCEKQYRLTQGILKVLIEHSYDGLVSILTKSPLVTRDINLIRSFKRLFDNYRAKKLTMAQRSEITKKAAVARWKDRLNNYFACFNFLAVIDFSNFFIFSSGFKSSGISPPMSSIVSLTVLPTCSCADIAAFS